MTGYSKPLSSSPILETDSLNTAIGKLEKAIEDKEVEGNYAGSSTNGGPATSAEKLSNTEQIGTSTKPVYFSADGVPVAIDYKLEKDVPSTAKLTDTTYSAGTGLRIDSADNNKIHNMGVLSVSESTTNGCVDFTVGKNGTETSESKTIPVHGLGDAAYKSVDAVVTKDSTSLITSGAVSTELDKKMDSSMRNSADGVAGLDGNSKINVSQIPTTDEYNVDSAYPVTGKAIEAAMNTLPNPMLYKGSLGTGGTITALPTASASNEGFTYKVITSGTYAGQSAKVGDVFISNGTEWTIIPSGDEPEGTVISVGMSVPTGLKIKEGTSPVTTSGTIEVQLDEGYVIPKEADIVPSTRKINNITLESDVVLDGDDIKATGYAKAESKSNITGTDTINQALGKLELKSDTNETNISTLAKHINGDLLDSDFQEDSTVAMTKTVPSGMSNYAAISKIGGKTVKDEENQVLKNAVVESVVSFPQNIWNEKWEVGSIQVDTGSNTNDARSVRSKEYTYIGNAKIIYTTYKYLKPRFYSANKTYIGYGITDNLNENMIYVPDGAKYFRFSTQSDYGNTYKNDICISLSEASYTPHTFDEITLLIPDSIKNLPDYGCAVSDTIYNWVDYENGTYTQMVAEVDLGDLNWTVVANYPNSFIASIVEIQMGELDKIGNILCDKYTANTFNKAIYKETDKTIALGTAHNVAITDKSYTDATAFKEAMKGVKLVYELETPVITDCSDMLMPIRCESGGTITFNNEHSLDMPNTVVYKKEVSLS